MISENIVKLFNLDKNSIEKIKGDASGREYFRVQIREESQILCVDPSLSTQENLFLQTQNVLKKEGFPVPEIHESSIENQSYLQEDLGDQSFLLAIGGANRDDKRTAYKEAFKIADKFLNFPLAKYPDLKSTQMKFDQAKYEFEQGMTCSYFFERFLNIKDKKEKDLLSHFYKELTRDLLDMKVALVHRDFHSKNLMIKNEKIYVIDFQDMRLGTLLYDYVSLIEDCYLPLEETLKCELKDSIAKKLKIKNFEKDYEVVKAQRLLKALGTFTNQYYEKGKIDYLPFISATIENLKTVGDHYDAGKKVVSLILAKFYSR